MNVKQLDLKRLIAQVKSMQRTAAEQLAQATNPKAKWEHSEDLQRKTSLLLILALDRLDEIERELTNERLKARYKPSA